MAGLFKAYYQANMGTARKYGGTGLGLALTKGVESTYGRRYQSH